VRRKRAGGRSAASDQWYFENCRCIIHPLQNTESICRTKDQHGRY
jgi:hypothetical protein